MNISWKSEASLRYPLQCPFHYCILFLRLKFLSTFHLMIKLPRNELTYLFWMLLLRTFYFVFRPPSGSRQGTLRPYSLCATVTSHFPWKGPFSTLFLLFIKTIFLSKIAYFITDVFSIISDLTFSMDRPISTLFV